MVKGAATILMSTLVMAPKMMPPMLNLGSFMLPLKGRLRRMAPVGSSSSVSPSSMGTSGASLDFTLLPRFQVADGDGAAAAHGAAGDCQVGVGLQAAVSMG
jgi:hypothetical protein